MQLASRTHALARMVKHGLRLDAPVEVAPSPRPTGHRARIKLMVRGSEIGYRPPRSHDLTPIVQCIAARSELQAAFVGLRSWIQDHPAPAPLSVELRTDAQAPAHVVLAVEGDTRAARIWAEGLSIGGGVAYNGRRVHGKTRLRLDVGSTYRYASPRTFYQVNAEVNEAMVAYVIALLGEHAPERVLDLYAGNGNFSLPIAQQLAPVLAVERAGSATEDARAAADEQQLQVRCFTGDVARFDPTREAFDAVVIDPPRAGAPGVLPKLALTRPKTMILVSCHLPSAARDVASARGYRIASVKAFDMFPNTHHIETVIALVRA
jgi:23S rRNA (uracil1939-C5)-methyltransferase